MTSLCPSHEIVEATTETLRSWLISIALTHKTRSSIIGYVHKKWRPWHRQKGYAEIANKAVVLWLV